DRCGFALVAIPLMCTLLPGSPHRGVTSTASGLAGARMSAAVVARSESPLPLLTTSVTWYFPGAAYVCLTGATDVATTGEEPSPKSHFAETIAAPFGSYDPLLSNSINSYHYYVLPT